MSPSPEGSPGTAPGMMIGLRVAREVLTNAAGVLVPGI